MRGLVLDPNFSNVKGLEYESEVFDYIDSLPLGSTFYDLGSCVGGFGIYACSKELKVIAFEVDSANYEGLMINYKLNKDNFSENHYFKSFNIGIADKKRKVILRIGQPEIGGHQKTLDLQEDDCADTIVIGNSLREVEVNSIDEVIEEYNLPYPNYLKIDIDGSEYAFVKGASKVLSYCTSLIIEINVYHRLFPKILEILEHHGLKETFRSNKDLGVPGLFNIIYLK
jgi:FkbM family methyltransferase